MFLGPFLCLAGSTVLLPSGSSSAMMFLGVARQVASHEFRDPKPIFLFQETFVRKC